MKDLIQKLSTIPDAYDDFILGVINYAKKSPSHIEMLNNFIENTISLTSSDVISFIISQPDFHSYSANNEAKQID